MKITKITLATLVAMSAILTSCDEDDNNIVAIDTPDTYTFTRDGESTVSFSGQTSRLRMVNEIGNGFKDTSLTIANFTEMFEDGTGFGEAALNDSGKNVNSKVGETSSDQASVQATFVDYYTKQVNEVFPNWDVTAEAGIAGVTADGRYVNAKGLEYNQAFYKGLIGALVGDQTMNDYLATVNDDENDVVSDGKTYTEMEHHFDEAYGYVFGNTEDDALMYKYLGRLDGDSDFAGITDATEAAFIAGRTAVVNKDYDTRDEQISVIRENLSKVIGVRAVYYLQQGKSNVGTEDSFHDLSEGYGFVYSLQFTHNPTTGNPYFTTSEVEAYLAQLEANNGFWSLSTDTLDDMSDEIAAAFGFTVEQAAN